MRASFIYTGSEQFVEVGGTTFARNKLTLVTDEAAIKELRSNGDFFEASYRAEEPAKPVASVPPPPKPAPAPAVTPPPPPAAPPADA